MAFDESGRLLMLSNLGVSGATISSFSYRYDQAGQRSRVVENGGAYVTWVYDKAGQLTANQRSGPNSYSYTYVYDHAGNRLVTKGFGAPVTAVYDSADRIVRSQGPSGIVTYLFDGAGNQTNLQGPSTQRVTLTWDGENRMKSYNANALVTYAYDGDGRRVLRWDATTSVVRYVNDGDTVLLEATGDNVIQAVHTVRPFEFGDEISQFRGGATVNYLFDGLGSTDSLTNSSGSVTDNYVYDGFGNIVASSGSTNNALRYVGMSGYQYDSISQQYFLRARYYDPSVGRFVSEDPFDSLMNRYAWNAMSRSPSSVLLSHDKNLYVYARNNPAMFTDPSGLLPFWWLGWCVLNPACRCLLVALGAGSAEVIYQLLKGNDASDVVKAGACVGAAYCAYYACFETAIASGMPYTAALAFCTAPFYLACHTCLESTGCKVPTALCL